MTATQILELNRQTKDIKSMGRVLILLSKEVEKRGKFDKDDQDLLAKVGARISFKAAALSYTEDNL